MARVAGADGTHGGWAVVFSEEDRWRIRKVAILSEIFTMLRVLNIVAVDVPTGLSCVCDRRTRQ